MDEIKIVVRGGGDLATGVIYRLHRAGFKIIVTELREPLVVRRTVSLAEAVYAGQIELEGLHAMCATTSEQALELIDSGRGIIPVLVDPEGGIIEKWRPDVVVDAVMAKRNVLQTRLSDASVVIGLGPGFIAGKDVHAVIETKRGHFLGRVLYQGAAEPNTGIPGEVEGVGRERVVYSPCAGEFRSDREIAQLIKAGEIFGYVGAMPLQANIGGCIRGLLRPHTYVQAGVKVGDIDPRQDAAYCYTISDKALAIGGGVLEAILTFCDKKITFGRSGGVEK